jgi:hypothetical protein
VANLAGNLTALYFQSLLAICVSRVWARRPFQLMLSTKCHCDVAGAYEKFVLYNRLSHVFICIRNLVLSCLTPGPMIPSLIARRCLTAQTVIALKSNFQTFAHSNFPTLNLYITAASLVTLCGRVDACTLLRICTYLVLTNLYITVNSLRSPRIPAVIGFHDTSIALSLPILPKAANRYLS